MRVPRYTVGTIEDDPYCPMPVEDVFAALHMLHEQAHGRDSFGLCQAEPCRSLVLPTTHMRGPAPRVLPVGMLA